MDSDNFLRDFILSYFKIHRDRYSVSEIAVSVGLPISLIDDAVDGLLQDEMLVYESHMLRLSQKGRLYILNRRADERDFTSAERVHFKIIDPAAAVPLDHVYTPKRFLSKI